MGGCYSAIKGMRKENGPAPETITKPAELPTEVGIPSKEEATISEVATVPFKDATIEEATTNVNEETMESSMVDGKINLKETKKDEDHEEENKDVEKVVDESKLIEKTLGEETSTKVDTVDDVAPKENQNTSKDIETMKE